MTGPARIVVRCERSGGFAGVSRVWTADSVELSVDAADLLRELVTAALNPAPAPTPAPAPDTDPHPGAADGFEYLVTARVGRRQHTWQGAEAAVPAVRDLAEHVRRVASAG